jgi:hypothetical protein
VPAIGLELTAARSRRWRLLQLRLPSCQSSKQGLDAPRKAEGANFRNFSYPR